MTPHIVAIAGPLKGAVFDLDRLEISVGRDVGNHVSIQDQSISRRHCLITRDEGGFTVRDLDSHNGTYVNHVPVKEQAIRHGDRLKVGSSYFLFLLAEAEAAVTNEVHFDEGSVVTGSTVRLRLEDALYLVARDLSALMRISQIAAAADSLQDLQGRLLEALFEVVPAERGAVVLTDGEGLDGGASFFADGRESGPREAMRISRTVAQQVLKEGTSMLCHDVLESEMLSHAESLKGSKVRSLLCVPLVLRTQAVGIIYLDSSSRSLSERHLQIATAIAGFAAGPLEIARRVARLENENRRLRADLRLDHRMVGESERMKAVYQTIGRVAPADTTVLVRGESGTGKELAAHAIHQNSPRADKPFVAINCAALTETLLESELFGYEKGAFTGALAQTKGKLEAADGGTVFLDEIGDMPMPLQAKMLRVLQERKFERVGGTRPVKVDLRVVAATNKELEAAVAAAEFRRDLYFRLNVITLLMPPLRERPEDIPLLANYFITKYSEKCKRPVTGLSPGARACLMNYDWPGNVRELENTIERAVVLGSTEWLLPEDLPEVLTEAAAPSGRTKFHEGVNEAKRQLVLNAVSQAEGNYTEAARLLGLHPNNLHRLIRNLGLRPKLSK
jgi:Nif-specific regulatory protein